MSDGDAMQRRGRSSAEGVPMTGGRRRPPAVASDGDHATRMERRRGRRGRNIVEGWALAIGAVLLIAVSAGVIRAVVASRTGGSASAGAPKEAVAATKHESAVSTPVASAVFAKMKKYGVALHFPTIDADMVAVGFHQAWNKKATDFQPTMSVHPKDAYADTKAALKKDRSLKLFEMMSRGRGSSEYSAADCAVKPGAIVISPVSGVVTLVTTYKLSGVGTDYRIEIEADGASPVRVVMIHLKDVTVKQGERVEGGVTPLATVRHLPIDNQVNRYLPVPADHTHIQINAVGYKLNESS